MKNERDTIINSGTYKLTGNNCSNNWRVKEMNKIMDLAVHMKNRKTGEKRIKKVKGENASNHEPVKDFYYGSDWVWTGTEPFKNIADDVEHISRGYYRKKG